MTTTTLGGLVALGALFGTIAAGDARVVRLYILSLFASGVGALIGALLNLRKVRVLIYGQAIALFAVVTCLMLLVGVILFGGQARALVDDVPKPDAKASGHVLQHQDYEGHYFTYEPEKAIDGDPETAWRVEGDGEDAYIQLDYTRPVKVSAVDIIPGHAKVDPTNGVNRFYQLHVVRRASIVFSDGTVKEAEFKRTNSSQRTSLDSPVTTKWVRIEIQDTYRSEALPEAPPNK